MEQCRYGAGGLFVSGGLFLLFRFNNVKDISLYVLAGGSAVVLSFLFSLVRGWKKLPGSDTLTTYLASRLPGGGVLLSMVECGENENAFPPLPELPRVRFLKWHRDVGILLTGLCFCTGTLIVPVRDTASPRTYQKLDLKDEEERLSRAIEAMKKAAPENKKAPFLEKELEEAIKNADPDSPGRTYELLNDINRRIQQELTRDILQQTELLKQINALQQATVDLSRSGLKGNSAKEFSQLLQALARKNPALAEKLKKGNFSGKTLDKKELEKLAQALKTDSAALERSLKNMSSYCENPVPGTAADPAAARKELEEFLNENVPGCDDLIESLTNRDNPGEPGESGGSMAGNNSGSGAPSRGRGDAPLEFSGITPDYGAKMIDRKAAPHSRNGDRDSKVVGRFASDAEQKEEKYTSPGGSLQTPAALPARQEHTVYPAHRRAVRRYFERKSL